MGDMNEKNEQKRKNELKKSMHYKDATSYKSFHEGTSNYLNLVDYYQQEKLKENQKMLENLGGNLKEDIFPDISEKLEMGDDNYDIDLAFYEKIENEEIDNIQGLKEAVKGLITKSKDKKVTKILKDLLAKISPIIDTDGEALKSYGLNTRYDELLEKYDNLKNGFENSEAEAKRKKAKEEAKKKAEEEAEKEAKKKAKEKAEKKENNNTSEKPKQKFLTDEQNNLMVRLFPKQARELGLKLILKPGEEEEEQPLPQEEMPAPTPEEQRAIIKEMTFSNLSEKVDNKSAESIENANNFAAKYFSAEYKKAYEEIKKNENNIPEAPAVPNALKKSNDNDNDEDDNDDNDSDENENIKTPEEMINEYKDEEDIKEEQYEYELFRTDYINKIESEISYSAGLINNIISEEKAKEETKEKVEKIEEEQDEDEENITESLNNDDEKSNTTKNETTDQNNNKTNINTDICKFLLKLLRQKESSINTSKIKDIFMAHTMFNTLSENKKMKPEDILDFMFKDDSDDYYDISDDDKTTIDFSFARFLFRLYYTISHGLNSKELNDKNKRGPKDLNEEPKFTKPYKDLIKGKAKKDEERQRQSLDSLSELIKEKLSNKDEPNKDVYKQIADYIDQLRNGEDIKIDTDKIKKLMATYKNTDNDSNNNLKDKIKIDAPIFKDENYFKIDPEINKNAIKMSNTNNKDNKETSKDKNDKL